MFIRTPIGTLAKAEILAEKLRDGIELDHFHWSIWDEPIKISNKDWELKIDPRRSSKD